MKKTFLLILIVFFLNTVNIFADSLNEGLVAYYPFNGNADDETGNGYDGEVFGAKLTEDRFGNSNQAYSFDGINDYIDISSLEIFGTVTVSAWISNYQNNDTDNFSGSIILADQSYHLLVGSENLVQVFTKAGKDCGSTWNNWDNGGLSYQDMNVFNGNWHNIVWSRDSSGNESLYIDGIKKAFANYSSGTYPSCSCGKFIGIAKSKCSGTIWGYSTGNIDDIRIYNRVLSEFDIQQLYNSPDQNPEIKDSDNDGVPDQWDDCENTAQNSWVNKNGCQNDNSIIQGDFDSDGKLSIKDILISFQTISGIVVPISNKTVSISCFNLNQMPDGDICIGKCF